MRAAREVTIADAGAVPTVIVHAVNDVDVALCETTSLYTFLSDDFEDLPGWFELCDICERRHKELPT